MTATPMPAANRWKTLAVPAAVVVAVAAVIVALPPGWVAHLTGWVRGAQAEYQTALAAAVRDLVQGQPWTAGGSLAILSFLYGVFHALGPGHGKAVIATYAAANLHQARRAVVLSFGAAFVQALSAITLVAGGFLLIEGGTRLVVRAGDRYLEPASYAAVALVGAWLAWRGLRGLLRHPPAAPGAAHDHPAHDHAHGHEHDHGHSHTHDPATECGCGHGHLPTPEQAAEARDWRRMVALSIAIGLRPCTGALLVLALSFGSGLWAAGIAAALCMGLGTALTVSVLAVAAGTLSRRAARHSAPSAPRRLRPALALAGGLVILALGLLLLTEALNRPSHPMLGGLSEASDGVRAG